MRIYEIIDEENNASVGILLYYEKEKTFICELKDGLDEWTAPFLFAGFVKRGIYTMPRDESLNWVRSRIIPPSRQNIDFILKTHKLKEYDENVFLEISRGICSQDSLYVKPIKELPQYVLDRQMRNLSSVMRLSGHGMLCVFNDGSVRKIELADISGIPKLEADIEKVLKNDELFASCKLGTGGYFITFNDSIDVPAWKLYDEGEKLSLSAEDLQMIFKTGLVDTSSACEMLNCSRQNLSYMVGKGLLSPVMNDVKGNLYSRDDVIRNMW